MWKMWTIQCFLPHLTHAKCDTTSDHGGLYFRLSDRRCHVLFSMIHEPEVMARERGDTSEEGAERF